MNNENKNLNGEAVLKAGSTLQGGKYLIEAVLGHGGFGITYRARHTMLDTQCCIKEFFMREFNVRQGNTVSVVTATTTSDPHGQFLAHKTKFIKEARRQAKLDNPHVVKVLDVWEENGTAYFAMDLVDGEPLSVMRDRQTGNLFGEEFVVNVLNQMLDVLEYIHSRGLWHLDIKPGNVMLTRDGVLKLIDFGASKTVSVNEGGSPSTSKLVYTPGYAAPEQIEQNIDAYGPWTDMFLLGTTLYNLLTGKTPPSPSQIYDEEADAFSFGSGVSQPMRQLVMALMQPRRVRRPQSVAELRQLMAQLMGSANVAPAEPAPVEETSLGGGAGDVVVVEDPKPAPQPKPWYSNTAVQLLAAAVVLVAIFFAIPRTDSSTDDDNTSTFDYVTDRKFTVDSISYYYTGPVENGLPWAGDSVVTVRYEGGGITYTGKVNYGHLTDENATMEFLQTPTLPAQRFEGEVRNGRMVKGRLTVTSGDSKGMYYVGTFIDNEHTGTGSWYTADGAPL